MGVRRGGGGVLSDASRIQCCGTAAGRGDANGVRKVNLEKQNCHLRYLPSRYIFRRSWSMSGSQITMSAYLCPMEFAHPLAIIPREDRSSAPGTQERREWRGEIMVPGTAGLAIFLSVMSRCCEIEYGKPTSAASAPLFDLSERGCQYLQGSRQPQSFHSFLVCRRWFRK